MASVIEVTQDVVYSLLGEKLAIPADSIVQSSSELINAQKLKGDGETYEIFFTGATQAGPVVWRVTADYCDTAQSIDEINLVKCPDGIEIIQNLGVEMVPADYEDAAY